MQDLSTATAFITGGAKGIGCGIARALAREGTRIALADLDDTALHHTAAELATLTQVETFHLDVQDRQAFAAAVDAAETRLGPITVLCNNAGVVFPEDLASMSYDVWDVALGINLGGVVNGIQTVLPRMRKRTEPAHIVNTASIAGLGPGGGTIYTTGKYAVVGLSESLRHHLAAAGAPIGISVLCPGAVATDITATGRNALAEVDAENSWAAIEYADRFTEAATDLLTRYGQNPELVGTMVVDAVHADRPFILTDRAAESHIAQRAQTILESMPAAPDRPDNATGIYGAASSLRSTELGQ